MSQYQHIEKIQILEDASSRVSRKGSTFQFSYHREPLGVRGVLYEFTATFPDVAEAELLKRAQYNVTLRDFRAVAAEQRVEVVLVY